MGVINKYLFTGSQRTIVVKKNILGSFGVKGLGILTSFVLVPYTIHLLDKEKYGIWITIFSSVTWFNMMDIGLGNGFRNKFAVAIALKKTQLAEAYVQTLYGSMILISAALLAIFFIVNPFLNWYRILNIGADFDENLNLAVITVFVLFCVQLVLKNVSTILLSLQKTTFSNSLLLCANALSLLVIFLTAQFFHHSLFSIAVIFMVSPIVIFSLATIRVFSTQLRHFHIRLFSFPEKKYFNELMSLGIKFFIIQITTVVMFSSSSIIISQLYGPAAVTPYNVTYQFFAATQIVFGIVITPFWTAFTEANAKGDNSWIRKSIKKLLGLWVIFSAGIILLWLVSPFIFRIWLGDKVTIPYQLSFQFALFAVLMSWSSIFSFFVAGIGKITVSLYGAIFQCIAYIPLAIFLATSANLKTTGIILATNLNLLIPVVFLSIQTKKIINNEAHGIWNK